MASHRSAEIRQFLGTGETRLIAAAYRDPARAGELFVLPDGDAGARREWTRTHLRCMFEDCAAPALTTVARANRRDGFSHGAGAGKHTPESVNHRQGKAVVAQWLRAKYPDALVQVEMSSDSQRSNVADVMLALPEGRRVAFEVQYAALPVETWRRRHESYLEQGILDVWLWGHTRIRDARREYAAGSYRLDEVQDEARKAGLQVAFLNPETAQIAVATSRWREREALAFQRECDLLVEDLANVRVYRRGLYSEAIADLARVSDERVHLEAERIQRAEIERTKREADMAADDRVWAKLREESDAYRRLVQSGPRVTTALAPGPGAPDTPSAALTCSVCGKPLADFLAPSGKHVVPCRPRRTNDPRRGLR